jgi:hypothetical protein
MGTPAILDSLAAVDKQMHRLLVSTLRHERLVAERDQEIAAVQKLRGPSIDKAAIEIGISTYQIEQYCVTHPESMEPGKKSVQLSNGLIGTRAPAHPGLELLNDKWTWEKVEAKLREFWNSKYFHKPKPPGPDKVKIKKELDEAQMKQCGLKLDDSETFYLELNRLAVADETAVEAAA